MKNPLVELSNQLHAEHAAEESKRAKAQAEAEATTESVFSAILSHATAFGGKPVAKAAQDAQERAPSASEAKGEGNPPAAAKAPEEAAATPEKKIENGSGKTAGQKRGGKRK